MIGIPKLKSDNGGPSFDPLQNEQIRPPSEASKPALPKNETPSRFWAFVEPYCKDVTQIDVKVITLYNSITYSPKFPVFNAG